MNTYFSKFWFSKLWLFKQKLSPHNIIQMPFWWICILWFILRCRDEKWWPASVFSAKEQSLGCSHQPSRSWKTPEKNYVDKNGWNGGMKKRDEAKQVRRIWTAPPVQVNTEPLAIWRYSALWEKMKISELLAFETAKMGSVFNTKRESKC